MNDSQLARNTPTDVKTLQVKQKLNEAKLICKDMDDNKRGRRCMNSMQQAESNFENEMRGRKQQKAIDSLPDRHENIMKQLEVT